VAKHESTQPAQPAPQSTPPMDHVHANVTPGQMPANAPAAMPGSGAAKGISGTVPPNWQQQPPSSMRQASFLATNEEGARADIALVILAGTGGGDLANVNRWRSQHEQPTWTQEQLDSETTPLESPLGKGFLVHIEGLPAGADPQVHGYTVAAVFFTGDETWFFKMTGNTEQVKSEEEAFVEWVRSVHVIDLPPDSAPADS